jgi:hypothetical protein
MRPAFQSVHATTFLPVATEADAGPFDDGEAACQRHDCCREVVSEGREPRAC